MRNEVERLSADFLGSVRKIDIMKNNKRRENEIYFTIERRDIYGEYIPQKESGYMTKTREMQKFIDESFFTGCESIKFIQWENVWNVVFDEARILGGISFRMEFSEFDKAFKGF